MGVGRQTTVSNGDTFWELDADKLDYLPRDCYMAGLPMPVDVDRLLKKLFVADIPASELTPEYRQMFDLVEDEFVRVLALQSSGTRAFEELVVSRALLFQKLYHHQKVRAMEGMIANAVELLATQSGAFSKISTYLDLADDEFLLGRWPSQRADSDYLRSKKLVTSVIKRQPFVRAFSLGPTIVNEEDKWPNLAVLVEDTGRTDLRHELADRTKVYLRAVGQPGLAADLHESDLLIDLPDVQGIVAKTRFFVSDDQLGVRKYGEGHEARRWTEAYEFQHTLGYVYCPREVAVAVYFAFRDIARERAEVTFKPESWSLAKLTAKELEGFVALLKERGIETDGFSYPVANYTANQTSQHQRSETRSHQLYATDIQRIEYRFRTYKSSTNRVASQAEIFEWLLQFSHDDIPIAVEMLNSISFWDRTAIADALWRGLEELAPEGSKRVQVFGIGGSTTSAHHLSYLWDDVKSSANFEIVVLNSLNEASGDTPLIFYDDNVGSGGQSSTVFMNGLASIQESGQFKRRIFSPSQLRPSRTFVLAIFPCAT